MRRKRLKLKSKMKKCLSYPEWEYYAKKIDDTRSKLTYQLEEIKKWKLIDESSQYDYEYIRYLTSHMAIARRGNDYEKVIFIIRSHSFRNVGNILNPTLYTQAYTSTKSLIEAYLKELQKCLIFIGQADNDQVNLQRKLEFFIETRHAVGRTALMLSGGGLFGLYHIGVVKVLWECNLLPKIITGSSAGSIMGSYICTKTNDELHQIFDSELVNFQAFTQEKVTIWTSIYRIFKYGYVRDSERMSSFLRDNIGDITFQEAFDKTGRIFNITVTGQKQNEQNRLLNYLTAPNVIIWSAVSASCSLPLIYAPTDLMCKNHLGQIVRYAKGQRFLDGSIGADIPVARMAEFFNVNCVIVSQVNPQVIPLLNHSEYLGHERTFLIKVFKISEWIRDLIWLEVKFRVLWLGKLGFLPSLLQKYGNIICQEYIGNINIWPIPKFHEYFNLVKEPSKEDYDYFLQRGQLRTFMRIAQIKAYTNFERSLDKIHQQVKKDESQYSISIEKVSLQEGNEDLANWELSCPEKQKVMRHQSFMLPRSKSREHVGVFSEKFKLKSHKKIE